jgi:pimeloyl-ACP methyl ester carboxylesterase
MKTRIPLNKMRFNPVYFLFLFSCMLFIFPLPGVGHTKIKTSYQTIHFRSGPYKLFGYYFSPQKHFNGKGIILCPGANDKGCSNILFPEICKRFAKMGYACLTFDFRNYGKSEGPAKVTHFKDLDFAEDAFSAVTTLIKHTPPIKEIIIVGHSMGGGVAVCTGVRDHRINKIVSISPGRRVKELFLKKNAPLGLQWILDRMNEDMARKITISLPVLREITLPIVIESYRNFIFLKPILFIEGTYEDKKDIDYLTHYVQDIKVMDRKDHIILPTNHWIGTANGKKVVFPVAIHILVVTIDAWIRNDQPALKDILKRVKRSKRVDVN